MPNWLRASARARSPVPGRRCSSPLTCVQAPMIISPPIRCSPCVMRPPNICGDYLPSLICHCQLQAAACLSYSSVKQFVGDVYGRNLCEIIVCPTIYARPLFTSGAAPRRHISHHASMSSCPHVFMSLCPHVFMSPCLHISMPVRLNHFQISTPPCLHTRMGIDEWVFVDRHLQLGNPKWAPTHGHWRGAWGVNIGNLALGNQVLEDTRS